MGKLVTIVSAIFLATGGFLFGYDSGIISSTLAQKHLLAYFGGGITDSEAGRIVSSFTGGAILGCLAVSFLADWIGRRMTVFTGSVIAVLGSAIQTGATSIAMLIAGRLIAGFAIGILSAVVPMYCSEIAQAEIRGALSGLLQWVLSWGFFVAQWLGYGCSHVDGHFQWRFPLAFQVLPALIMCGGIWFLQESPRWLIEKERYEEARQVLSKLHGDGNNQDILELEFQEIRDTIVADRSLDIVPWKAIFTRATWRRRLLLGCGVQAFGQFSGVNVINYYGPRIYDGSFSIVYCTIGLWALERVGRVKPLIFSATGCGLSLVVNAALSSYLPSDDNNQLRAMVAMIFCFSFFFTMTGIISWVYPAELFPIEIRAKGNSIATFVNWSLNLVFAQVSPIAFTAMGFRYFFIFFVFNIIAALSYIFLYPETSGRTLEQMDELFGDQIVPHAMKEPEAAAKVMASTLEDTHQDEKKTEV
ncbi:general substrate transporter [Ilyonectria robusta]|uniref:general substrate transporter n=1 Tax=Ilyonectria robusta TaxID=1079257 RepID=UPI001E8E3561|nr:general substrate transporter [Ilyonectria robusta]KAH8683701.1 general substrate transporter [Ilyonectria robusta]